MVYQHEWGCILGMDGTCKEELPYYRFVEIDPDTGFTLATGKGSIIGVTIASVQDYLITPDGTSKVRNSYIKGEPPQILQIGVGHVELEEDVKKGERITIGTEGKAKPAGKSEIVVGFALDSKSKGEIVRITLNLP